MCSCVYFAYFVNIKCKEGEWLSYKGKVKKVWDEK